MGKTHRFGRIGNKLGLFRRDQRGNVAVIVGAAIIPLVGALGLATDTARGYLVKARLSQALDAATLAGGKVYFSTQRDADIKKYFAANFPSTTTPVYDVQYTASFMDAQVTLHTPVNGGVQGKENLTIKAEATVPTTFMRVLGFQTVTVDATSQVTRAISALDTVISMDFSGSMASPTTEDHLGARRRHHLRQRRLRHQHDVAAADGRRRDLQPAEHRLRAVELQDAGDHAGAELYVLHELPPGRLEQGRLHRSGYRRGRYSLEGEQFGSTAVAEAREFAGRLEWLRLCPLPGRPVQRRRCSRQRRCRHRAWPGPGRLRRQHAPMVWLGADGGRRRRAA